MGFRVQEKKMRMVVGQAEATTFLLHPEAAAQFASSSKE